MADNVQPQPVEFDLAMLAPVQQGQQVVLDMGVDEQSVHDLKALLDQVRMNGTVDARTTQTNRITGQLTHFFRNYGQPHNPIFVAQTNVRYNDRLGAQLLGLIYKRRGHLEACTGRIGRNGNFLHEATSDFFALLCRVPGSGIPAAPVHLAVGPHRDLVLATLKQRANIEQAIYEQVRLMWKIITGQQSEADRRSRSGVREVSEENARLRVRIELLEQELPIGGPQQPPPLPREHQLPAPAPPAHRGRGQRGRRQRGRGGQ